MSILKEIEDAYLRLRPKDPFIKSVWFVDTPRYFSLLQKELGPLMQIDTMFGRMPIIDLYVFMRATATEDEWLHAPWFAAIPGVWVEMSSGPPLLFLLEGGLPSWETYSQVLPGSVSPTWC
jgi:hypothetical protein